MKNLLNEKHHFWAQSFQSIPYRLNARDRTNLDLLIAEYKNAKIITDTNSEFMSPVFIVRNTDSTPRIVADYWRLNKMTKSYNFLIPNFDDLLENWNGGKWFIKLNVALGYLQMPLREKSKEKPDFIAETQTNHLNGRCLVWWIPICTLRN